MSYSASSRLARRAARGRRVEIERLLIRGPRLARPNGARLAISGNPGSALPKASLRPLVSAALRRFAVLPCPLRSACWPGMPGSGARSRMRSANGTRGLAAGAVGAGAAGAGGGGVTLRFRPAARAASASRAPPRWCRRACRRSFGPVVHRHQVAMHGIETLGGGAAELGFVGDEAGGFLGGLARDLSGLGEASTRSINWCSALSISPILASCASARPSC